MSNLRIKLIRFIEVNKYIRDYEPDEQFPISVELQENANYLIWLFENELRYC